MHMHVNVCNALVLLVERVCFGRASVSQYFRNGGKKQRRSLVPNRLPARHRRPAGQHLLPYVVSTQ